MEAGSPEPSTPMVLPPVPTLAGSSAASPALAAPRPGGWRLQAGGVVLFLFIPVVLYLFVRHPDPIGGSLLAGVLLMLSHRFLARPYMARALAWKCLWCNRVLQPAPDPSTATLDLAAGGAVLAARCCTGHRHPAARFLSFLDRARWPLRVGIFLPLLLLLAALAAAGVPGWEARELAGAPARVSFLPGATAVFQLLVGLAVSAAAWGYLLARRPPRPPRLLLTTPPAPIAVPFPAHNFFLLGLRALLWIFRLVGAWWIVAGARYFLR